jgi:predicted ester cyclase
MAAFITLDSPTAVQAFMEDYYDAWQTDEERLLSYFAEEASLEVIPGTLMNGRAAIRDQFIHPLMVGFPGNRHVKKNMVFGRDVVVVEWSFEAEHKGPFAGVSATGAHVAVQGCSVYEFDAVNSKITGGRVYFDVTTLLKQISAA